MCVCVCVCVCVFMCVCVCLLGKVADEKGGEMGVIGLKI